MNWESANESTNRDYWVALRRFGKNFTYGDEVPESLAWISSGTPSDYDPTPEPTKMLRWDTNI